MPDDVLMQCALSSLYEDRADPTSLERAPPRSFVALRSPDLTEFNDIARHIDAYAETGCTLQLFDANGARTRPLLGLAGTATIQATFDPRT